MKKSKNKDKVKNKLIDDVNLDVPAAKTEMPVEKSGPTKKKDVSFSNDHEPELHVNSGETGNGVTFETSLQKKRFEKSKQKKKEKKIKQMAKQSGYIFALGLSI